MMNTVRDTVAGSYDCLELETQAVAKEVEKLLKDDRFTLGGPVSTLPFTMPD
jgi:hypothetical protein